MQLVFATVFAVHINGEAPGEEGAVAETEITTVSPKASRSGFELAVMVIRLPDELIVQFLPDAETMVGLPTGVNADEIVSVMQPMTPVPVLVAVSVYVCVAETALVVGEIVNVHEVASQKNVSACRPDNCPSAVALR